MEELESRTNLLTARRERLEEKLKLRSTTMTEFSTVREEKIEKISHRLEAQNGEAKTRNLRVLRDMGQELNKYTKLVAKFDDKSKLGTRTKIREAKLHYLRSIEKMLPVYRVNITNQRLEKARKLHEMKEAVEKRRQLRKALDNEDSKAQTLLDNERRDYILQRSLEQKDELQFNSKYLATKIQRQQADEAILQEVDKDLVAEQQVFQNVVNCSSATDEVFAERRGDRSPAKSSDVYIKADSASQSSQSPYSFLASSPPKEISERIPEYQSSSMVRPSLSSGNNLELLIPERQDAEDKSQLGNSGGVVGGLDYDNIVLYSPKKVFESTSPLATPSSLGSNNQDKANIDASSSRRNEHRKLLISEYTKVLNIMFVYIDQISDHDDRNSTDLAYKEASSQNLSVSTMEELIQNVLTLGTIPSDVSSCKVAASAFFILKEIGAEVFPNESLNGVVTLDKIQKSLKRTGGGRSELLKCITNHLVAVVGKGKVDAEEICTLFTSCLVCFIDDVSEKSRVERKISKLLQLTALTNENSRSQSPSSFVAQDRTNVHTADVPTSTEFNISEKGSDSTPLKKSTVVHSYDDEFEDLLDNEVIEAPPKVKDLFDENQMGVGISEDVDSSIN